MGRKKRKHQDVSVDCWKKHWTVLRVNIYESLSQDMAMDRLIK